MADTDRKNHWDTIYETKQPNEVSWTQDTPTTSLDCIRRFNLPKTAAIIDIGGGDSKLVDCLLDEGYTHITVLDISAKAIERAKHRLAQRADNVTWIVCDILDFNPTEKYDCWHDRAAFHFLTTPADIQTYIDTANRAVTSYMVLGTFSDKGPLKCSGLDVHRYSDTTLQQALAGNYEKLHCITEDHTTPFNTKQNFLFCSFKRI